MAKPVITYRSSVYSTTNSSPYTASPTWTPAANSLIVAFVAPGYAAGSGVDPTGVTAHGVTLTKLTLSASALPVASPTHSLSIWVGNAGASPTSTACVATCGGSPLGCVIIEFEITGWESSEAPINAFGKAALIDTNINTTGTTGTVTIQLRPDVTSEHVLMSFWVHLANEATTFRTNWTETAGADGNFNTPATGAEAQFRTDAFELTASATWTTSINWRGYALVVRGTSTTPEEFPKISDTVTARLNPDPISLATETLTLADTLTVTPLDLARAVTAESLKLADGGVATQQGIVQLLGVVHIQDTVTPLMEAPPDLSIAIPDETLHVQDVFPFSGLQVVIASEGLRINDQPPFIEERLRVVDTVTADMPGAAADLSRAVTDETIRISDAVTAQLTPLQPTAALSESLRLADTVTAQLTPLQPTIALSESLRLADTVTASLNPLETLATEALKVQDTGSAQLTPLQPTVALTEAVRVQDTVAATLDPLQASPAESLKVIDTVVASMGDLVQAVTEVLKLADSVSATLNPEETSTPTESLKVQDVITASMGDLVVIVLNEVLKLADTVTASLTPLVSSTPAEALRVADTLAAELTPLQAAPTEALKVQDTLIASMGDLVVIVLNEILKIADSVTVSLNPLQASPAPTESLKVIDTLVASMGDLVTVPTTEVLKVADTIAATLDPEQTSTPAESLKVQDALTASMGVLAVSGIDETVRLADTVTAQVTLLQVAPSESLKVIDSTEFAVTLTGPGQAAVAEILKIADAVTPTLDPEQTSLTTESLKVQDTLTAAIERSAALTTEALKVQDTLTASRGLDGTPIGESVRITDTLTAQLTVLRVAVPSDLLHVRDLLTVGVNLLSVFITEETLHVQDFKLEPLVPQRIVHVRPRVGTIYVRPRARVGTVHVRPQARTVHTKE